MSWIVTGMRASVASPIQINFTQGFTVMEQREKIAVCLSIRASQCGPARSDCTSSIYSYSFRPGWGWKSILCCPVIHSLCSIFKLRFCHGLRSSGSTHQANAWTNMWQWNIFVFHTDSSTSFREQTVPKALLFYKTPNFLHLCITHTTISSDI